MDTEAFPDSGQNADRRPSKSRPRDKSFMPESQVVGKEALSVENAMWLKKEKLSNVAKRRPCGLHRDTLLKLTG